VLGYFSPRHRWARPFLRKKLALPQQAGKANIIGPPLTGLMMPWCDTTNYNIRLSPMSKKIFKKNKKNKARSRKTAKNHPDPLLPARNIRL
jgi:hypothetical protein